MSKQNNEPELNVSAEEEELFLCWWYEHRAEVLEFANKEPIWTARRIARSAWQASLVALRIPACTTDLPHRP